MEVYLTFSWIAQSPLWALLYLAASMGAGWLCMMLAKVGFRGIKSQIVMARQSHGLRALLVFGKLWIIGALLFFPGYLTDILAALIYLFAKNTGGGRDDEGGGRIVETRARIVDE